MPTAFERLGGEAGLRPIIDEFVDRMFDDVMIGFFFRKVTRKHIKELEYQHAAAFFGGSVVYRGRTLREAHKAHPIMGGQFARRKRILEETMIAHAVPEDLREALLTHTESLREQITGNRGDDCDPETARGKS